MKKFLTWKLWTVLIVTLFLGIYDLPTEIQKSILPFVPEVLQNSKIHLGLDLQGGSQLDYKIDLRKVPEADQASIIDGVKEVIERRVNGLGVAEPNIYISDLADEKHIVVELAETAQISQEDIDTYLGDKKTPDELNDDEKKFVSLEKAKATVGKTIQLEFKEEKESLDPQEKEKVRANAVAALEKIKGGTEFSVVGQEEQQAFPGKVQYEKTEFKFADEIPEGLQEKVETLKVGEFTKELVEVGGSFSIGQSGEPVENTGLVIVKLVDKKEEVKSEKSVDTRHVLIQYQGADGSEADITRSEEEAYELIKEIKVKLDSGEDFVKIAKEYSDEPGAENTGGFLPTPVTGNGAYVYDFETTALALKNKGDISDIIKTKFGYHIIKADDIKANVKEAKYMYEIIAFSTMPDPWKDTGLTGKHFVHADIQLDNFYQPYVLIQFNDEGAKLFEELTEKNIDKQIAIFVGGNLISAPKVNEKIAGGSAQITGQFTTEEAKNLARDLNTGAIPAPIVLTGEYTIGATLGQEALNTSLYAGLIGLILVMVFMLIYYRAAGLVANGALIVYASILIFLIKSQLHIGVALVLALGVFFYLIIKILENKDSGWEKFLSFILSCFAFFFLAFLLKTGVVMTLAGIAGLILSIGMAVDANILIFERFKEEIQSGKTFSASIETGFTRAWTAIRDSNFSTLLTCAILFTFGSSIIKGFAFNLAAGILVSMFTAIVVTKMLMQGFVGKKIASNLKMFGVSKKEKKTLDFIKYSKLWIGFSGVMVGLSLIAIMVFGLNLGIDFNGGTLLEFKFSEPVTQEQLSNSLKEIEVAINNGEGKSAVASEEVGAEETSISATEDSKVDLTAIKILESGENNYIVKTKYLTSENHDKIIGLMKDKLPKFTEPRFTTIGPIIGATLLKKATFAIFAALIMIIVYIGFAFRKVPRDVNPWRFGATAIIALTHDVIIVTGIFAILGQYLNVEIDALFITAMLTVFGYSVNDTIVIFDRLRENLIRESAGESLANVTNNSLSQTLARSINTSFSTLIVLIAVLIWGSPSIFYFVLALTIGIAVGTYSSIFTASPILVWWTKIAKK